MPSLEHLGTDVQAVDLQLRLNPLELTASKRSPIQPRLLIHQSPTVRFFILTDDNCPVPPAGEAYEESRCRNFEAGETPKPQPGPWQRSKWPSNSNDHQSV